MQQQQVRICRQCNESKPLTEFHKDKSKPLGYKYNCKNCQKVVRKEYYQKNKEALLIASREYYQKNKEALLITKREYYQKNKEAVLITKKEYYQKNKEAVLIAKREYKKQKRLTDPYFKLVHNLRRRLNHAIKGNHKSAPTLVLLGCSPQELRKHLEVQFETGMSWDNYGEWHVDHIKPCIAFDLTKEEEQRKCFHYSNLQPLWAKDNLSKGKTFDELSNI